MGGSFLGNLLNIDSRNDALSRIVEKKSLETEVSSLPPNYASLKKIEELRGRVDQQYLEDQAKAIRKQMLSQERVHRMMDKRKR